MFFAFAMGAAAGSFTNVLIWRLPRGQSIREPRWSYCPACESRLTFPDLVPLFSFLLLGGRCRHCKEAVSWRYFWVEAICALLWSVLWWQNLVIGWSPVSFAAYALFATALVAIVFIDFEHYIIPDQLNAWLLLVGAAFGVVKIATQDPSGWVELGGLRLPAFFVGAWSGTLILWGIGAFGRLLFRKDAMGHGDVKMMRGAGALLPLDLLLASIALAVVLGACVGLAIVLVSLARRRQSRQEGDEEERPAAPEPLALLPLWAAYYLLWLDLLPLLVPKLGAAVDGAFLLIARRLAPGLALSEGEPDEEFHPTPTTIAFGPFLAIGVGAVLFLGPTIRAAIDAYVRWVTGGN